MDIREEILRKRRAGKLPGDTTSLLKGWWQTHSKWPYPTVSVATLSLSWLEFGKHGLLIRRNILLGGRQGKIGAGNRVAIEADK